MENEQQPDKIAFFRALIPDADILNELDQFMIESAKSGTKSNELMLKIFNLTDEYKNKEGFGALMLNILWFCRNMSKATNVDESTLLATVCTVLLRVQQRMRMKQNYSAN